MFWLGQGANGCNSRQWSSAQGVAGLVEVDPMTAESVPPPLNQWDGLLGSFYLDPRGHSCEGWDGCVAGGCVPPHLNPPASWVLGVGWEGWDVCAMA